MKDEIKEILDELNDMFQLSELEQQVKDIEKVIDYITNLEQEVNKLTAESTEWESKCYDLQKENERLKIEKQEEYNRFNLMAKFRDKALERTLIYKSRVDETVEFCNYLLKNNEITINNKKYYKQEADDIIIYAIMNMLIGDDVNG